VRDRERGVIEITLMVTLATYRSTFHSQATISPHPWCEGVTGVTETGIQQAYSGACTQFCCPVIPFFSALITTEETGFRG